MKTAFMAMLAWLGLLAGAVPAADPLAGAAWIRDERFQGHEVLGVFEAHQKKAKSTILQNIHSYFRKEFELSEEPARAQLCFSADDYAKLYVNGRFVVQGPEPSYPFAQPFCQIDVTGALRAGRNCLAAHAYYHGLACRAFNSADNRSGLIVRLEISFADGSTQTLVSDGTWNCFAAQTFSSDRTFGYATQFNEDIDLTKEPHGWRDVGFVDEAWPKAVAARQDHEFVKQITPPLDHWRADPVTFEEKEPGRWFVDFGIEVAGHTRIRVQGARGHVMTVWHGEELSAPKTVRHDMRCNCDYVDKITLSGADDLVEFYDYRGFRYIELLDAPGKPQVWVDVRHHPFDWEATHFASSNETLNRIWEISKRAVQMGCQKTWSGPKSASQPHPARWRRGMRRGSSTE